MSYFLIISAKALFLTKSELTFYPEYPSLSIPKLKLDCLARENFGPFEVKITF